MNTLQRYYREANREALSIGFSIFRYNLKSNKMDKINPRWAIVVVIILAILLNYYNSTR